MKSPEQGSVLSGQVSAITEVYTSAAFVTASNRRHTLIITGKQAVGGTGPTVRTLEHSLSRGYHTPCGIVFTERKCKASPHQSRPCQNSCWQIFSASVMWPATEPGTGVHVCPPPDLLRSKVTNKGSELPSLVWWFTLLVPGLRRWERCKFKARLSNKTLKRTSSSNKEEWGSRAMCMALWSSSACPPGSRALRSLQGAAALQG